MTDKGEKQNYRVVELLIILFNIVIRYNDAKTISDGSTTFGIICPLGVATIILDSIRDKTNKHNLEWPQ